MERHTQLAALAITALTVLAFVGPAAAVSGGATFAQSDTTNATATQTETPAPTATPQQEETQTETSDSCDPRAGGPKLQQSRLYSPQPEITADEHGQIAGAIALDIQNECDVVVQLTLTVPSGMYIAGAGDLSSGGGGIITSTFEVQPGETKSLRGNVYSSSIGEKTVTGDLTYYPEGHKDEAREIDGIMLNFDVQEENMPNDPEEPDVENNSTSSGGDGPDDGGLGIVDYLFGLIGVTQIGLLLLVGLGLVMVTKAMPDALELIFERD
jgi:invasion protein IalB